MRKNQGITLIALIITIIVMLILVGVVVTVVIQSDLLGTAKNAGNEYKAAYEKESSISGVTINGKEYGSIEDYMNEINPIIVEPENIDDWIYVLEDDGTITINGYKGSDKEVVIPNYINGVPVKKIGKVTHVTAYGVEFGSFWDPSICKGGSAYYWYIQNDITSVTISNGIETIGGFAFFASQALNKIIIPSSVKTIETNVFSYCIALNEITIPSNVTTMGNQVFLYIPSITVHVPWKEGEKPEGWADNWAANSSGTVTIDYAK